MVKGDKKMRITRLADGQEKRDNYCTELTAIHDGTVLKKITDIVTNVNPTRMTWDRKLKKSFKNYRNQLRKKLCYPCTRIHRPEIGIMDVTRSFVNEPETKRLAEWYRHIDMPHELRKEFLPVINEVIEEVPVHAECHGCKVFECKVKITGLTGRRKRVNKKTGKIIKKDPYMIIKYLKQKLRETGERMTLKLPEIFTDEVIEAVLNAAKIAGMEMNEAFEDLSEEEALQNFQKAQVETMKSSWDNTEDEIFNDLSKKKERLPDSFNPGT